MKTLIFLIFCNIYIINVSTTFNNLPFNNVSNKSLILTPLIENGHYKIAQALARVRPLRYGAEISYSGFFTVDKRYNSNMFFWFFPAAKNPETAPVVLWLEGGPGVSTLYSIFNLHGPFYVDKNGDLKLRDLSWTSTHSVIYIDNPVGTGFSFTDFEEGYSKDEVDVGNNLYSAVIQFLQMFPQYQKNDFFIAGESYAGKYVPALGYAVHTKNPSDKTKINLKGLIMGNPFIDPESMITGYGDFYYYLGLIDYQQREIYRGIQQKGVKLIQEQKWMEAYDTIDVLLSSMYRNFTGYTNTYNFLHPIEDQPFGNYEEFVQRKYIRRAINVGNATLNSGLKPFLVLQPDIMQSVKPWVEILVENYPVLIYSGQMDLHVAYQYTLNFLYILNWSGAEEYKTAARNKWYVGEALAGYSKTVKNLTEVMIRNAGHLPPVDQPEWTLDLLTRFTSNKPIA